MLANPLAKSTGLGFFISASQKLVLDPFMGIGTTAVVCKKLDINFIGFDIDSHYIDIANERLQIEKITKIPSVPSMVLSSVIETQFKNKIKSKNCALTSFF